MIHEFATRQPFNRRIQTCETETYRKKQYYEQVKSQRRQRILLQKANSANTDGGSSTSMQ